MKRSYLFLLFIFSALYLSAQQRLDYGIGINFNVPTVKVNQASSRFSTKAGYGLGLFASYSLDHSPLGISMKLEADRTPYFSESLAKNIQVDGLDLMLGINATVKQMDSTIFKFHFVPSVANVYTYDINSRNTQSLNGQLDHNFDIGINLGSEIRLSKYTGLEFSYTYRVLAKRQSQYYDAMPNCLTVSLNLHFNKNKDKALQKQEMSVMLDSLSKDTLYIVNSACSEKMTDEKLYSLFQQAYNFSAFRVIKSEDVASVKENNSPFFFAFVGELFGGEGEPASNGIYLMDSNFELTEYPYPVHTNYYEPLITGPCFDSESATLQTIRSFNRRLYNSR